MRKAMVKNIMEWFHHCLHIGCSKVIVSPGIVRTSVANIIGYHIFEEAQNISNWRSRVAVVFTDDILKVDEVQNVYITNHLCNHREHWSAFLQTWVGKKGDDVSDTFLTSNFQVRQRPRVILKHSTHEAMPSEPRVILCWGQPWILSEGLDKPRQLASSCTTRRWFANKICIGKN